MPTIRLAEGLSLHCAVDDYLWPWEVPIPVLMMHGFARNANFWNRWIPPIANSRRVYRPDLLGCGKSDVPAPGYAYTPEKIGAQILAVLDAYSLPQVHWVGESSGGIIGLLLAAASSRTHRQPRLMQYSDAHSRRDPRDLCARPGEHRRGDPGPWHRRVVPTNSRLPPRPRACEPGFAGMGHRRDGRDAARHRRRLARSVSKPIDVRPLLPGGTQLPVLLFSGDKSPDRLGAAENSRRQAAARPARAVCRVGHGVNLLQPERCARMALEFWRTAGEVRR